MEQKPIWNGQLFIEPDQQQREEETGSKAPVITGIAEIDEVLAPMSQDERKKAIDYLFAPKTGKELWDQYKAERDKGWRPSVEQFERMEAYRNEANDEVFSDMIDSMGVAAGDIGAALAKAVTSPVESAKKIVPSSIEALWQGTRDTYGMLAHAEDPGSVFFEFKDLVTGKGTVQDRYKQFLRAADFQSYSEKLYKGEETLLFDKRLLDPDFVRAIAYIAEPDAFIPLGGVLMRGARAAGMGSAMAKAQIKAQALKTGLISGALEYGVGRPAELIGGALRDSIEFGLQKTAGAIESVTGIDSSDVARVARITGAGTATASVAGYSVPFVAPVSTAYFGGGFVQGFGEAVRMVADQRRRMGGHRGLFSFAEEVLERVEADDVMRGKLAPSTVQMLRLINKADPILSYSANAAEGTIWGGLVGGGLGYLHAQGSGFGAGFGQGVVLGAGASTLGKVVVDATGATNRLRQSIQAHFANRLYAEFDPASAAEMSSLRGDARISPELAEVLDGVSIAIGRYEGEVEFRAPETHSELLAMAADFASRNNVPLTSPETGFLAGDDFSTKEGWVVRRANGKMFIGVNRSLLLRKGNKWAVNTLPHELFHAVVRTGIMGPHFSRVLREEILGEFDSNGNRLRKGSVEIAELRQFFETYHKAETGPLAQLDPARRKAYYKEKADLQSALDKLEASGKTASSGPLNADEVRVIERLSEEFGAYYFSNWFREKGSEFFLRGGRYTGVRAAVENVKNWWMDHWESRINAHQRVFNFHAASLNPDGGTALEEGFHRDGNRVRIGSIDRLLTDMTRAGAMMRRKGVLDISDMSEGTLRNFLERHGLDELVTKDRRGRNRARKWTDELNRDMSLGPEAFKALDGIAPSMRTSVTTPEGFIEGRLSDYEIDTLVVKGFISEEMGNKIRMFQRSVDDPNMSNVVHLTYAGKTMETTVGPGPRLRGNKVPISHRELIVVDVISKIGRDGAFSFRIRALDNKVIKRRQNVVWMSPTVRALWKSNWDDYVNDFNRYLANASLPHNDPNRVPSENLWTDGLGSARRDALHQVAGFAKAEDLPYINTPIAAIPRGMLSAVGDFSIGRMFNVSFGNTRIPYNHANAFYPISQNFKPSGAPEVTPDGSEIYSSDTGHKIVKSGKISVALTPKGMVIGTFDGEDSYTKAVEAIEKHATDAIANFEERQRESFKVDLDEIAKSSKRYEEILATIPEERRTNFTVNDLVAHIWQHALVQSPAFFNKRSQYSRTALLDEHVFFSTAKVLGLQDMFKRDRDEVYLEIPGGEFDGQRIPSLRFSYKMGADPGTIVSASVLIEGKDYGYGTLPDSIAYMYINNLMYNYFKKFDGGSIAVEGFWGGVNPDVFESGSLGFNPKAANHNGVHFGAGTDISAHAGKGERPGTVESGVAQATGQMVPLIDSKWKEDGIVRRPMAMVGLAFRKVKVLQFDYASIRTNAHKSRGEPYQVTVTREGVVGVDGPPFVVPDETGRFVDVRRPSDREGKAAFDKMAMEVTEKASMDYFDSEVTKAKSEGFDGIVFVGRTNHPGSAIRFVAIPPIGKEMSNSTMSDVLAAKTFATNIEGDTAKGIKSGYYDKIPPISFPGQVPPSLRNRVFTVESSMQRTAPKQPMRFAADSQSGLPTRGVFKPAPINVFVAERTLPTFNQTFDFLSAYFGFTDPTDDPNWADYDRIVRHSLDNRLPYRPETIIKAAERYEQIEGEVERSNPLLSEAEWAANLEEEKKRLAEFAAKAEIDYGVARIIFKALDKIEDAFSGVQSHGRRFMVNAIDGNYVQFVNEHIDGMYEALDYYVRLQRGERVSSSEIQNIQYLGGDGSYSALSKASQEMFSRIDEFRRIVSEMTGGFIDLTVESRTSTYEDGNTARVMLSDESNKLSGNKYERLTFKWSEKAKAIAQDYASIMPGGMEFVREDFTWSVMAANPAVQAAIQDPEFRQRQESYRSILQEASNRSTQNRKNANERMGQAEGVYEKAKEAAENASYGVYTANWETLISEKSAEIFAEYIKSLPIDSLMASAGVLDVSGMSDTSLVKEFSEMAIKLQKAKVAMDAYERVKHGMSMLSKDDPLLEAYKHALGAVIQNHYLRRENGYAAEVTIPDEASALAGTVAEDIKVVDRFLGSNANANVLMSERIHGIVRDARNAHKDAAYDGSLISGLEYAVGEIIRKNPDGLTAKDLLKKIEDMHQAYGRGEAGSVPTLDEAKMTGLLDYLKEKAKAPKDKTTGKVPKVDYEELRKFVESTKVEPYVSKDAPFDVGNWWDRWTMKPENSERVGYGSIVVRARNPDQFPARGRGSHIQYFKGKDGPGPEDTGPGRDTYFWSRFTDRKMPDGKVVRFIEELQTHNNSEIRQAVTTEVKLLESALNAAAKDKTWEDAFAAHTNFGTAAEAVAVERFFDYGETVRSFMSKLPEWARFQNAEEWIEIFRTKSYVDSPERRRAYEKMTPAEKRALKHYMRGISKVAAHMFDNEVWLLEQQIENSGRIAYDIINRGYSLRSENFTSEELLWFARNGTLDRPSAKEAAWHRAMYSLETLWTNNAIKLIKPDGSEVSANESVNAIRDMIRGEIDKVYESFGAGDMDSWRALSPEMKARVYMDSLNSANKFVFGLAKSILSEDVVQALFDEFGASLDSSISSKADRTEYVTFQRVVDNASDNKMMRERVQSILGVNVPETIVLSKDMVPFLGDHKIMVTGQKAMARAFKSVISREVESRWSANAYAKSDSEIPVPFESMRGEMARIRIQAYQYKAFADAFRAISMSQSPIETLDMPFFAAAGLDVSSISPDVYTADSEWVSSRYVLRQDLNDPKTVGQVLERVYDTGHVNPGLSGGPADIITALFRAIISDGNKSALENDGREPIFISNFARGDFRSATENVGYVGELGATNPESYQNLFEAKRSAFTSGYPLNYSNHASAWLRAKYPTTESFEAAGIRGLSVVSAADGAAVPLPNPENRYANIGHSVDYMFDLMNSERIESRAIYSMLRGVANGKFREKDTSTPKGQVEMKKRAMDFLGKFFPEILKLHDSLGLKISDHTSLFRWSNEAYRADWNNSRDTKSALYAGIDTALDSISKAESPDSDSYKAGVKMLRETVETFIKKSMPKGNGIEDWRALSRKLAKIPFLEGKEWMALSFKALLRSAMVDGVDYISIPTAADNGSASGLRLGKAVDIYDTLVPSQWDKYAKKKGLPRAWEPMTRLIDLPLSDAVLSPEKQAKLRESLRDSRVYREEVMGRLFTIGKGEESAVVLKPKPELASGMYELMRSIAYLPTPAYPENTSGYAVPGHVSAVGTKSPEDGAGYFEDLLASRSSTDSAVGLRRGGDGETKASHSVRDFISHIASSYLHGVVSKRRSAGDSAKADASNFKETFYSAFFLKDGQQSILGAFIQNANFVFRKDSKFLAGLDGLRFVEINQNASSRGGPDDGFVRVKVSGDLDGVTRINSAMQVFKRYIEEAADTGRISPEAKKAALDFAAYHDALVWEAGLWADFIEAFDHTKSNSSSIFARGHTWDVKKAPAEFVDEVMNRGQTAFKPAAGMWGGADVSMNTRPFKSGFISELAEAFPDLINKVRLRFEYPRSLDKESIVSLVIYPRGEESLTEESREVVFSAMLNKETMTAVGLSESSDNEGYYSRIAMHELGIRVSAMGFRHLEGDFRNPDINPYDADDVATGPDEETAIEPETDVMSKPSPSVVAVGTSGRVWKTMKEVGGLTISSTDGYFISVKNNKFRLFNPDRALMGVYDDEEEAKRKAGIHADRRRKAKS